MPSNQNRGSVTFHRAKLLGYDSMPTHYFWRVVCLVFMSQMGGWARIDGGSALQQCAYAHTSVTHTHTLFSYRSLFYYSYSYTLHRPPVIMFHSYLYLWRCGKMDVCQILMGQTQTYFRACTSLHTVSTGDNVLFIYTREDVLSKESRFCFFCPNRPRQKSSTIYFCRLYFTTS